MDFFWWFLSVLLKFFDFFERSQFLTALYRCSCNDNWLGTDCRQEPTVEINLALVFVGNVGCQPKGLATLEGLKDEGFNWWKRDSTIEQYYKEYTTGDYLYHYDDVEIGVYATGHEASLDGTKFILSFGYVNSLEQRFKNVNLSVLLKHLLYK